MQYSIKLYYVYVTASYDYDQANTCQCHEGKYFSSRFKLFFLQLGVQ